MMTSPDGRAGYTSRYLLLIARNLSRSSGLDRNTRRIRIPDTHPDSISCKDHLENGPVVGVIEVCQRSL